MPTSQPDYEAADCAVHVLSLTVALQVNRCPLLKLHGVSAACSKYGASDVLARSGSVANVHTGSKSCRSAIKAKDAIAVGSQAALQLPVQLFRAIFAPQKPPRTPDKREALESLCTQPLS